MVKKTVLPSKSDALLKTLPLVIPKLKELGKEGLDHSLDRIAQVVGQKGIDKLLDAAPYQQMLEELFSDGRAKQVMRDIANQEVPTNSGIDFNNQIIYDSIQILTKDIDDVIFKQKKIPSKKKMEEIIKVIVCKSALLGRHRANIMMQKAIKMGLLDSCLVTVPNIPILAPWVNKSINTFVNNLLAVPSDLTMKVMNGLMKKVSKGAETLANKSAQFANSRKRNDGISAYKIALKILANVAFLKGFCDIVVPLMDWWYSPSCSTQQGNPNLDTTAGGLHVVYEDKAAGEKSEGKNSLELNLGNLRVTYPDLPQPSKQKEPPEKEKRKS